MFAAGAVGALLLVAMPTAAFADDVFRTGNYTVPAGHTIDGNLTVRNDNVIIHGTVDGNVRQVGRGYVHVTRRRPREP